jgi:hypothetical protein
MLSRDTLRYKEIQSDIGYRRDVGALGSARRSEERASEVVRAREQLFWKEVARISAGPRSHAPVVSSSPAASGPVASPLDRVLAAHSKLLEAKRDHASALVDLQAGVTRVSQSDALRTKVSELQQALKQRCAALLEGKREDELSEMMTQVPTLRRNAAAAWPQRATETELTGAASKVAAPSIIIAERPPAGSVALVVSVPPPAPNPSDRIVGSLGTVGSAPIVAPAPGSVREIPTIQSVEVHSQGQGPSLRVQSVLSSGVPVTISLTRSSAGGVSAVVESPNVAITGQLTRERAGLLAKLGSLGVSLSGLEVRRGGDASVGGERPLRRPRWAEEGDDETGIA